MSIFIGRKQGDNALGSVCLYVCFSVGRMDRCYQVQVQAMQSMITMIFFILFFFFSIILSQYQNGTCSPGPLKSPDARLSLKKRKRHDV